jgi:ribonuclease III
MQGPEHDALFVVEVFAGEIIFGKGQGRSKRNAERKAAEEALASEAIRNLALKVAVTPS